MDRLLGLSRHLAEPCFHLLLIFYIDAFTGYHWPRGEDTKDVFWGRRQSPLGPEVSASPQERHWEQPEVAEVSNERERKENSTDAGTGMCLYGSHGTAERRVHGQAARSGKWCSCMICSDFFCSFDSLPVCLLLPAEGNRMCHGEWWKEEISPSGVSKFKGNTFLCIANLGGIYSSWIYNPF